MMRWHIVEVGGQVFDHTMPHLHDVLQKRVNSRHDIFDGESITQHLGQFKSGAAECPPDREFRILTKCSEASSQFVKTKGTTHGLHDSGEVESSIQIDFWVNNCR